MIRCAACGRTQEEAERDGTSLTCIALRDRSTKQWACESHFTWSKKTVKTQDATTEALRSIAQWHEQQRDTLWNGKPDRHDICLGDFHSAAAALLRATANLVEVARS